MSKTKATPSPTLPVKERGSKEARAWQRMLSGRRLDLLDPSPLDVEIGDIAHGLARVARWNGQTEGAHIFSVAQHTLLVETLARARWPRIDRVADALDAGQPLTAGGLALTLAEPDVVRIPAKQPTA